MKLHVITIALDAMPFIACHLPVFNTLALDWHWHVVEGYAAPVKDTAWCSAMTPRLSVDGTTEYLDSIKSHKRVTVYRKPLWQGKTEMVNAALRDLQGDGLVWQVDSDECWSKAQIEDVVRMLDDPDFAEFSRVQFRCRYFMGPDIVITSDNTYGNHHAYEWFRVWRWKAGQLFEMHEPPVMGGNDGGTMILWNRSDLVFQHYAYATEEQVAFKERYYGYTGAVEQWRKLQANTKWPARLGDFCKWVKDETIVDKL